MSAEEGEPVELYVYDLTHGMASVLSPAILGHQIEGIWHTAVVVFGKEYFYGGSGITSCAPGSTQLGAPLRVEALGRTFVPHQLFLEYVQGLAATTYRGSQYNLLEHNCNNFSEELSQFLCGVHIPKHILELPTRALAPPLRAALQLLLDGMTPSMREQSTYTNGIRSYRQDSPDFVTLNSQIEEARATGQQLEKQRSTLAEKVARKERRKEKKRRRMHHAHAHAHPHGDGDGDGDGDLLDEDPMAEAVETASVVMEAAARAGPSCERALQADAEEARQEEALRQAREPPIVFKDIDGASELAALQQALSGSAAGESAGGREALEELRLYLVEGEGSWALGDDFLAFIGGVLSGEGVGEGAATAALRCLCACALRDDVSLLLHQDRRSHAITNYAHNIDRLSLAEQRALALFFCNLFENVSASEWLLYISEWEHRGQQLSNIKVTTKVAVHALLSEDEELKDIGTALMHNIAIKEVKTVRFLIGKALRDLLPKGAKSKVFDDVCVELAMALLQFLSTGAGAAAAGEGTTGEERVYRCFRALARLAQHSQEVPHLLQMLAVSPDAFRGTSQRIDEQIDILMTKVK